jgi:hypothetical protein
MDELATFADLPHPVFDADNHYYEALDAFTRHLDPAVGSRTASRGPERSGSKSRAWRAAGCSPPWA